MRYKKEFKIECIKFLKQKEYKTNTCKFHYKTFKKRLEYGIEFMI